MYEGVVCPLRWKQCHQQQRVYHIRGTSPFSCLANLQAPQERQRSHAGRWLLRSSDFLPVVSLAVLAFQGLRPPARLLLHRARDSLSDPTPDANKAHHSLRFVSLPACTPPHRRSLRTAILHSIHYSPRLYTHYILLAIFTLAAPSTLIKCPQTPRSNHE